ncbi:MAG: fumarylacetoacetate hydrolase family protein [Pseudomonadota bacterium]
MRLASRDDGTRDGRLLLVSADLARSIEADAAHTLQQALDHWSEVQPWLQAEASRLERVADLAAFPFDPAQCLAPLPRGHQWLDGSAYLNHVSLVRRARGAALPPSLTTDPLMYQGASDHFLAPMAPIRVADESFGIDLEGELGVITDDVPLDADAATAADAIRLLVLVNDVSLRELIPGELTKGFGFVQSKPASALAPVAVTPDEIGAAWDGRRAHLTLLAGIDDTPLGRLATGPDMTFDFPTLIAHAARTRPLGAGTLIGSGTVSNADGDDPGRPLAEGGRGYACIAEQRMAETIRYGEPRTAYLGFGDRVHLEAFDARGRTVFGRIDQRVEPIP